MKKIIYLIFFSAIIISGLFAQNYRISYQGSIDSSDVDTVSRKGATELTSMQKGFFNQYWFTIYTADTLLVDSSASFTTGSAIIVLPNIVYSTQRPLSSVKYPHLFVRRYTTGAGNSKYYIVVEGY